MSNEVRISGAQTTPRSECDIAVFRGDNTKVIAASNVSHSPGPQAQFYSSDGGFTWGQSALPLSQGDTDHTDPEVGWSSDGTPWAMVIGLSNNQIRLYTSNDGGNNWTFDSTPSGTDTDCDRETFWIDNSMTSPFKDYQYTAYQLVGAQKLRFARRKGSSASWDSPVTLTGAETTSNPLGVDIRTNNYGDVFVFWPDAGTRNVFVRKSTDGGGTFPNAPKKIATQLGTIQYGVPAQGERNVAAYVIGGAYRDATRDIVHAVWSDLSGESGCTSGTGPGTDTTSSCKSRIWYSRSTDGGGTWSAPTKINDSSSKNDQFFPALAIDPVNGNAALIYYDTIADSGRKKVDVWMQVSSDDGANWSTATRITSQSTDETASSADNVANGPNGLGDQLGDYIGLDLNAGVAFPAWCDRRNGAREEIWTSTTNIAIKALSFIVERSTFGQDEVQAIVKLNSPNPAPVSPAFFVVVDGFSANDLGIQASDYSGAPAKKPVFNATAFGGMTFGDPTKLTADDETNFTSPQRFTWTYGVSFTDDSGFTQAVTVLTLNASISTASGTAQMRMLQQPNPFETDGDPPWLSTDLRVFSVDEGGAGKFGATLGGNTSADAVQFIKDVISNLNSGNTGGQSFDSDLDPAGAPLALFQKHLNGKKVFNFAVAKVRYNSLGVKAKQCRVFFRLIPALTVSTAYDTSTVYRQYSDGVQYGTKVPRLGRQNNNILSIPCFAETRVQSDSSKPNPKSMDSQPDPSNIADLKFDASGKEVDTYFGCWLDINQPGEKWFPLNPSSEGPFSGTLLSVLELVRNQHQCLVAEIAFDSGDPIPTGATPFTSDKLAQRNLDLVPTANPGVITSRTVPSTFELKPTPANVTQPSHADELMIDWGHTPAGSRAQIYLPTVRADDIIAIANQRYSRAGITKVDDHTIAMPVRKITYVPIPPGPKLNHTGLITIDLPLGIRKGQKFHVSVRQLSRVGNVIDQRTEVGDHAHSASSSATGKLDWRYVLGAFQIDIPVKTKDTMLVDEERLLALLRWILLTIPTHDRWYPVFHKYVEAIAGRVAGLGGDPEKVPPSPTWTPKPLPHPHPGHGDEGKLHATGKIAGLVFDHFGDFEGFVLETEEGDRRYGSREREIKQLAERAWAERLRITVISEHDEPHRPLRIIVRQPPAPLHG